LIDFFGGPGFDSGAALLWKPNFVVHLDLGAGSTVPLSNKNTCADEYIYGPCLCPSCFTDISLTLPLVLVFDREFS
jgi:hypothetical protein